MSMTKEEVIVEIEKMLVVPQSFYRICPEGLRDALRYLKEPTLPVVPSDAILKAINDARGHSSLNIEGNRKVYDAIRAALLTPPKPKMKTVWCVAYTMAMNVGGKLTCTDSIARHPTERDAKNSVQYMKETDYYTSISPIWTEEVEDK
jgi:hypothetical protein